MGAGKRKIEIKKIEKETSRIVTFSKRKKGLFKKAQEFQSKTGSTIVVIVFSPAGKPYSYGDPASIDTALNAILNRCNVRSGDTPAASTSTAVLGSDYDRIAPVTLTAPSEEGLNGEHRGRGRGLDGTGTFARSTIGNCDGFGPMVDTGGGTGCGFNCTSTFSSSTSDSSNGFGLLVDNFVVAGYGFNGTVTETCSSVSAGIS